MSSSLYELLGCSSSATQEQILTEYRARVRDIHPDKVADAEKETAEKRFCELQTAREVLCDPLKRRHYDAYLSMKPNMTLKEWMDNKDKLGQDYPKFQTMHWAQPKEKTLSLPQGERDGTPQDHDTTADPTSGWARHNSSVLSAFRSYRI